MPNPLVPTLPSWPQLKDAAKKGLARTQLPPRPELFQDVEGDDDPHAIDPVAEGRPAYNPYRGSEFHGVEPKERWVPDAEGYGDGTVSVIYDEDTGPEHVVPVRIVSGDEAETFLAFRVDQFIVPSDRVITLVPRNRQRKTLKVRNLNQGGNRVWVGNTQEIVQYGGAGGAVHSVGAFPIMGNSSESFNTTEAIFAIAAGPNADGSAQVVIYYEFEQTH
jgi:hypothetical protein